MSHDISEPLPHTDPEGPVLPEGWSRADLHVHTNLSDGIASPRRVVDEALRRGLRVIAITDHDSLEGAKRVADILAREHLPIDLIMGTEVTTSAGHFIGLFMEKRIKIYKSVEYSIDAIKEQGGICVIPHPLGRLVPSLSRRKIEDLLARGYVIDGIETYNPSPANAAARDAVRQLNGTWNFASVGSSDAHFWQHIGAGYTLFQGTTANDLRHALISRSTRSGGQETPPTPMPIPAYVAQCAWAWFVDPARRVRRMIADPVK
ncbi:MAG TPA: PHP domain-containing protein [Ktedonobacterales bacterium]|nr:PHP domain-containing protein [Ktedonobacterales bacterium]